MVIKLPGGSNSGGSSGGAPSGSAGGSLTGTYPDPTIATIPSGATATTQAAADSSTKVATTAFATTADNLKANLAGPTFTGVVTLPTGAVATTQTADNNSTALATTAYADTIKALKANLASPTFTGTPALPTGTTGVTQSAADGSTKLATTAYTDTADALKANLASPTFTGTPTLPTGTILTTQAAGDSTTKPASTAFVQANGASRFGYGPGLVATFDPKMSAAVAAAHASTNDCRTVRVTIPKTGTLHDLTCWVITQSGNIKFLIYDCGNANGTHTTRTLLANSGVVSVAAAANSWATVYDPALAVTEGDTLELGVACDNTTATFATFSGSAALWTLPTSFYPPSGAGTASPKLACTIATAYTTPPSTVTEANMVASAKLILIIGRIT